MDDSVLSIIDAAYAGDAELIQASPEFRDDIDSRDDAGDTALIVCCVNFFPECITLLLSNGASPDATDASGMTGLQHVVVHANAEKVISALVSYGATVNLPDDLGNTPLMNAAAQGRCENVRTLLRHSAEVNCQNSEGETALSYACAWEHEPAAGLLLENGADPNLRFGNGSTALLTSVAKCSREFAEALIAHGADVNACDDSGVTPLMVSVWAKNEPVAMALLDAQGIDTQHRDSQGKMAVDHARAAGLERVVSLLEGG